MQLNIPPDLEVLINKRLSTGAYTDIDDVLRSALNAQEAEEGWTDDERRAISAHIDEGFSQAEQGKTVDAAQVCREIGVMKENWRRARG